MFSRTLTFAQRANNMSLSAGVRTMATRSLKEFLCIMPDKPNVLQIRKRVKDQHYEGIKPLIESERLVAGGAMFERHPDDAAEASFRGSVVVYTGESPEEVKTLIESDVYATSGVWDLERVQIVPYVAAVRQPVSS